MNFTDTNKIENLSSKSVPTKRVIVLAMLFVSFLIISNLTAFKIVELNVFNEFNINFPAALVFFPLTYFFDDVLTEVYGFKLSRLIIWSGLVCSALVTLCTYIAVQLPAAAIWEQSTNHGSEAYTLVFKGSARVFLASIIAYFFGEFLNSIILAKLKIITKGRYFSLRIMGSTAIGVGVDTVLFCSIAFFKIIPQTLIWQIIITQYLIKIGYELIMLPITYGLIAYLKIADNVDYYDTKTNFNPFSLKLTD